MQSIITNVKLDFNKLRSETDSAVKSAKESTKQLREDAMQRMDEVPFLVDFYFAVPIHPQPSQLQSELDKLRLEMRTGKVVAAVPVSVPAPVADGGAPLPEQFVEEVVKCRAWKQCAVTLDPQNDKRHLRTEQAVLIMQQQIQARCFGITESFCSFNNTNTPDPGEIVAGGRGAAAEAGNCDAGHL